MHSIDKIILKSVNLIFKKLFSKMPLKNIMIFESSPDYACNTYPVFLEMKKQFPNYKMVWLVVSKTEKQKEVHDLIYLDTDDFKNRIKYLYYMYRCKVAIYSNRSYQKYDKRQLVIYLCHGSKTKSTKEISAIGQLVDFINIQSHFFDEIALYEYSCNKEQLVYLGYPRCDYLYENTKKIVFNKIIGQQTDRIILWLPTFRVSRFGRIEAKDSKYNNLGMPLIYSVEQLHELDNFLREKQVSIIFKPHPAQDITELKIEKLSNIHIINDVMLKEWHLQLYQVVSASDALITDYSSVFYDYLLLNKPIATTTDDLVSWKSGRGFAFDLETLYDKATIRVPDYEGLKKFIVSVVNEEDLKQTDRCEIRDLTNMYNDGNSTKRVVEFVKQHIL